MKKAIIIISLLLVSLFACSQDTTKLKSSHQMYRLKGEDDIKDLHGSYLLSLYRQDTIKYLSIQNLEDTKDTKIYIARDLIQGFTNEDSVLLNFQGELTTPPTTECVIRIMMKGDRIILIGIVSPWGILAYLIDSPEGKL